MKRNNLFVTPVFKEKIGAAKLNQRLTDTVGAMMSENPESPVQRSNMGGWHSKTDIFEPERMNQLGKHGDTLEELGIKIDGFFRDVIDNVVEGKGWEATLDMSGWATVLKDESWNSPHTHPNSSWSFIYYVDTANVDDEEGCIVFQDPRSSALQHVKSPGDFNNPSHKIQPEDGLIIMFPSWLEHYVTPYYSDDLRIGISGNIIMTNIEVYE